MAVKTIKNVKRVSARELKNNEYVKADNIRVSRAGKICLETFKKRNAWKISTRFFFKLFIIPYLIYWNFISFIIFSIAPELFFT